MTTRPNHTANSNSIGFTLLEMMIVLMLIAVIAGAVVMGRTMIRSAELQAVLREYDSYIKAIQEFNTKYAQLPGDFSRAETIWGTAPGARGTCPTLNYYATGWDSTATCNGNGNGRIGASTNAGVFSDIGEWWLAWQQLSNAGLIDGRYTGGVAASAIAQEAEIGNNVPSSRLTPAGWTLFYMQQIADSASLWGEATGGYGHMLSFGLTASGTYTRAGAIRPADALDIDNKIDDGKPGAGTVRTWRTGYLANCTENDTTRTAQTYKVSRADPVCSLLFILGL